MASAVANRWRSIAGKCLVFGLALLPLGFLVVDIVNANLGPDPGQVLTEALGIPVASGYARHYPVKESNRLVGLVALPADAGVVCLFLCRVASAGLPAADSGLDGSLGHLYQTPLHYCRRCRVPGDGTPGDHIYPGNDEAYRAVVEAVASFDLPGCDTRVGAFPLAGKK